MIATVAATGHRAPAPDPIGPVITDREYAAFQDFLERVTGVHLSDAKRALLTGRLTRRLRELSIPTFGAYFQRVIDDADERIACLDRLLTNETRFFREPKHFELLEREMVPRWIAEAEAGTRARRVRVWSAACSSGEEPYSVAMLLEHHLPRARGWDVEVLATDLSTRMLGRAREATWPIERAGDIPREYLEAFMLRGVRSQLGRMSAGPEIRARVRIERLNLIEDPRPAGGPFDLIFCRNVLIYFQRDTRTKVVESLLEHLRPDGVLFVGHAENLHGASHRLRSIAPTVYARAAAEGGLAAARTRLASRGAR